MIFKRRQLVQIFAEGVLNYTESSFSTVASTNGFRTDTEISGKQNEQLFGRELQHASSWLDPGLDIGELEDNRNRSSKSWNQFEANEKLFGVTSSYDENLYTTKLDKTKLSTEQSAKAERLAREIEKQATTNFHLQEERGQVIHDDEDIDEEARYSSVDRQFGRSSSAYVPPALRNTQKQGVTKSTPSSSSYGDAVASKPVSFSDAVKGKPSPPVPTKQTPPGTKSESKPQSPEKQSETSSTPKAQSPSKKTTSLTKSKLSPTKTSSPLKKKPQSPTKTPETKPEDSKPPAPAKKGLNPNAKEFKLSAGAASFTPEKFTAGGHPGGGYPRQPHPQHYSHGHHIPVPPMYGVPEEWIYENGAAVEEGEYPPNAYAPYGAPMGPNGSMMQPMYPPVMPQQRGGRGYGGYHHGAYNPRGYYPAMPYPGVMGPQPPLPRYVMIFLTDYLN
jgi:hypothetical protein